jgi:hypothetical protein
MHSCKQEVADSTPFTLPFDDGPGRGDLCEEQLADLSLHRQQVVSARIDSTEESSSALPPPLPALRIAADHDCPSIGSDL